MKILCVIVSVQLQQQRFVRKFIQWSSKLSKTMRCNFRKNNKNNYKNKRLFFKTVKSQNLKWYLQTHLQSAQFLSVQFLSTLILFDYPHPSHQQVKTALLCKPYNKVYGILLPNKPYPWFQAF